MSESFISKAIIVKCMPSNFPIFKRSTVKVQEQRVYWKSGNSEGKLDLLDIFKEMEKERGFLVADEAYENLPVQVKSSVNADQLLQLTTDSSYLFIEFEKWYDFEEWVDGNFYLEMLIALNSIDGASSSHIFRDSFVEAAWVYDMNYQFVSKDIIKYKIAFHENDRNIAVVQCEAIYEDLNISEAVTEIFNKYKRHVDRVNYKIVEIFVQNSLREILASSLSKDIITPKKKGIEYRSYNPLSTISEYEQWFVALECNYKTDQIANHLQSLKQNDDSIMQMLRILEIQKLSLQIALARVYSHAEYAREDYRKIESRLNDLRRSREDINRSIQENSQQRNDCTLDCRCILF